MSLRAAASLVALAALAVPARAADDAALKWKYDNPFCQVVAGVTPASEGRGYQLALFTSRGATIDAHVTLVSANDAFDAHVAGMPLSGSPGDRQTEPMLLTVPSSDPPRYFFVDSYAIDGAAAVTCPSYVFEVAEETVALPTGAPEIHAAHLQSIGPLKCGETYTQPRMRGDLTSPAGAYGGGRLVAVVRAYVDSNGYALREELAQSSGVEGWDKFALGAVGVHQFDPARFLCVPVVGQIEIKLTYYP
jgi:hypothetical protein